jgi:hypothetical protein
MDHGVLIDYMMHRNLCHFCTNIVWYDIYKFRIMKMLHKKWLCAFLIPVLKAEIVHVWIGHPIRKKNKKWTNGLTGSVTTMVFQTMWPSHSWSHDLFHLISQYSLVSSSNLFWIHHRSGSLASYCYSREKSMLLLPCASLDFFFLILFHLFLSWYLLSLLLHGHLLLHFQRFSRH